MLLCKQFTKENDTSQSLGCVLVVPTGRDREGGREDGKCCCIIKDATAQSRGNRHLNKLTPMRNYFVIASLTSLLISSCELSVKKTNSNEDKSKIRNGINIQAKGIVVEQA